jgi:5'-deoxynucleotidase YfbR-like HD superfamily hydrolase
MAGHVKRWHTWPTLRVQTVAAHSHAAAMLLWQVYPEASKEMIVAMLAHDLPEISTGDVPAHVKWSNPEISKVLDAMEQSWLDDAGLNYALKPLEVNILKFCDSFELMLWSIEELKMGNRYMERVIKAITARLDGFCPTDMALYLFREARREAEALIGDLTL